jgi:hypothetical protein
MLIKNAGQLIGIFIAIDLKESAAAQFDHCAHLVESFPTKAIHYWSFLESSNSVFHTRDFE